MTTKTLKNNILADGRWSGNNGIGRFSHEILSRLKNTDTFHYGPKPLSIKNFIWQFFQLHRNKNNYRIYFTPGFNPVFFTKLPYAITICDLIYLRSPGMNGFFKKIFFEIFVKHSIKNASKVLTISEYSKNEILAWTKLSPEKIINIGCGISETFSPRGKKHQPGYPYLLHVGNTKKHKNIERLIRAFAEAKIDSSIKLVFTSQFNDSLAHIIKHYQIKHRIVFLNTLSESELANCYRGAIALVFPSICEGFGLPIVEAMASGIPVLTSNTSSCPEVAGSAAILINPLHYHEIKEGIENIVTDEKLRYNLIERGLKQAKRFSWEKTAALAQQALEY